MEFNLQIQPNLSQLAFLKLEIVSWSHFTLSREPFFGHTNWLINNLERTVNAFKKMNRKLLVRILFMKICQPFIKDNSLLFEVQALRNQD